MNVGKLKELISNVNDEYSVFVDGDHQGCSTAVGLHVGWVYFEEEYEAYGIEDNQVTDDEDEANENEDLYFSGDCQKGIIIYGVG